MLLNTNDSPQEDDPLHLEIIHLDHIDYRSQEYINSTQVIKLIALIRATPKCLNILFDVHGGIITDCSMFTCHSLWQSALRHCNCSKSTSVFEMGIPLQSAPRGHSYNNSTLQLVQLWQIQSLVQSLVQLE